MSELSPNRGWKRPASYVAVASLAAFISVILYMGLTYGYERLTHKTESSALLDAPAAADTSSGDNGLMALKRSSESFREIAKRVGPAVVNIKSTKGAPKKKGRPALRRSPRPHRQEQEEGSPFGNDPFFDFFDQFRNPGGPMQEMPQTSLGSGVIIDKKGIVVTNNHVVEGATEILVNLSGDKIDLKAKVIGTDPRTDLAVLKIEGKNNFPAVEWADSDAAEVGDWAIAIGSPFALGQSVTVGIISAKGRNSAALLGAEFGNDLIQTDAAINPGNSGGPLCDINGKVLGVNTAIYTRSGGYMGIGFAIPANTAKEVVNKLITHGKVVRGWLGVFIQPLDEELAKELGVKDGVGIHEVMENSPAAKAGLNSGDVIIEVEGKIIKDPTQLQREIGNYQPGQTVKMKIASYRDKKQRSVTVKVGEVPDNPEQPGVESEPSNSEPDSLGLVVAQSKSKDGGVVIQYIQQGSPSEGFGLEVGDTILSINRKKVKTTQDYERLIKENARLYLEVKRKDRLLFFQFVLPR